MLIKLNAKMFKLVVLCLTLLNLVSVKGAAADPPKPKMNDTFHATGTVVVDVGDSIMAGTCMMTLVRICMLWYNSPHYLQLR